MKLEKPSPLITKLICSPREELLLEKDVGNTSQWSEHLDQINYNLFGLHKWLELGTHFNTLKVCNANAMSSNTRRFSVLPIVVFFSYYYYFPSTKLQVLGRSKRSKPVV